MRHMKNWPKKLSEKITKDRFLKKSPYMKEISEILLNRLHSVNYSQHGTITLNLNTLEDYKTLFMRKGWLTVEMRKLLGAEKMLRLWVVKETEHINNS